MLHLFITCNLPKSSAPCQSSTPHSLTAKPSMALKPMCGVEHIPSDWDRAAQLQAQPSVKGNGEVTTLDLKVSFFRFKQL